ncbi:MAG: superoxide dismutase family protein [Clostridia bacterium]|nr:superoxide dismutase family protein [Clostridia bacterium]
MLTNILYDAKADIKGGKDFPKINGTVYFKQTKNGVMVTAKIKNLPQAKDNCTGRFFGFHIHSGNSCTGNAEDEFANVKTHYNPTNCPHPFHKGDLPPLIENNGDAYMSVLINKFTVKDIIGRTVVIHDSPDDFTTQPSGNSGKKIACGVVRR